MAEFSESVNAATQTPAGSTITETLTPFNIGITISNLQDNASVTLADE